MNKQTLLTAAISLLAGMGIMAAYDRSGGRESIGPDGSKASGANVAATASVTPNPGAVQVDLFVMSQCPYGVQAVDTWKEAVDKLGADVDLHIEYIGNEDPGGNLTSMHGPSEVKGNIAQLCAKKVAPGAYLKMIGCQNKNMRAVDTNWESCAKESGIPVEPLKACIEGNDGKELLKASYARAQERGAQGSPTMYVGGKEYQGQRSPDALVRAVCAAHQGPKRPSVCASLPELAKVTVYLMGDKRCAECDTDRLAQMVSARIGNPDIRKMDYTTEEGRKLYDELGGGPLPMIVFDDSLDADQEASKTLSQGLTKVGKYRKVSVGDSWNPRCMETDGCKLDECKNTLSCRTETPNTLELFVMSQCPYGVMALDAMKEVLANLDKKLDFRVHYIANGDAKSGFNALHGQPEVDENIRELCAAKHYGKGRKYMDYIWCRSPNIRSNDWQSCTGSNGIATQKIKACAEGAEGPRLHEEDIKIANALGVGGSPTWIVNGRYKFSGIDAETIRRNICEHNAALQGCDKKLSEGKAQVPAGAGCGQ